MDKKIALILFLGLFLGQSFLSPELGGSFVAAQKKEKGQGGETGKKNKKGSSNAKSDVIDPKTKQRVDYLFIEASTLYLQEKKTEAIGLFKELLTVDTKNHAAMYNIGKIQNELKHYGEAIKYCKMALDLNPENIWYYTELAKAYEGAHDMQKALDVQVALVKRFPDEKNALYDLAQLYILNKEFQKAIEIYNNLEALSGENDEISFRKHQLYIYTNQTDKAMAEINKLIEANPNETRFYQAKYDLLMLNNKQSEAQAVLEKILENDPNDGFAMLSLADYYRSIGQIQKSDQYLERAFDNPKVELETKVQILSGMYQAAENDKAVLQRMDQMSQSLIKLYPKSAMVFGIRGDVLQAAEQADSARVYYRKSLKIDPTNEKVWSELLILDSEKNDYEAMQKDAERALEYYPNQVLYLYFFGTASTQNGDNEEAIYAFEKIKKTEIKDKDLLLQTYLSLAECYHKEEQFAKSDENFEAALKLAPANALVLNNYAYYLSLRNARLEDATAMVLKALQAEPDNGAYQDTYGWILYLQGKYKDAELWIGKAVQHGGGSEVLEHYGDTWSKLGDPNQARDYWQRAIDLGATFQLEDKIKGSDR